MLPVLIILTQVYVHTTPYHRSTHTFQLVGCAFTHHDSTCTKHLLQITTIALQLLHYQSKCYIYCASDGTATTLIISLLHILHRYH